MVRQPERSLRYGPSDSYKRGPWHLISYKKRRHVVDFKVIVKENQHMVSRP